jgi:hypothetical protein
VTVLQSWSARVIEDFPENLVAPPNLTGYICWGLLVKVFIAANTRRNKAFIVQRQFLVCNHCGPSSRLVLAYVVQFLEAGSYVSHVCAYSCLMAPVQL